MSAPAWAENFIGIPFKEKGRTREGVDCWGAVRLVLQEHFGIVGLPDYCDSYESKDDKQGIAAAVQTGLLVGWQEVEQPSAGALLILRLTGRPWHCAIMLDELYMLHALDGVGVVHERIDTMLWRNRIEGIYRYAA